MSLSGNYTNLTFTTFEFTDFLGKMFNFIRIDSQYIEALVLDNWSFSNITLEEEF